MNPAKQSRNVPASVRARLRDLARDRHVELQLLLSDFAIECLLYRLGASSHSDRFGVKGATLFKLGSDESHRATPVCSSASARMLMACLHYHL